MRAVTHSVGACFEAIGAEYLIDTAKQLLSSLQNGPVTKHFTHTSLHGMGHKIWFSGGMVRTYSSNGQV